MSHQRNYLEDAGNPEEQNSQKEALIRKVQLIGPLSDAEKAHVMKIVERCIERFTITLNGGRHWLTGGLSGRESILASSRQTRLNLS